MIDFLLSLSAAAHGAAPALGLGGIWDAIVTDFAKLGEPAAWVVFGQV